MSIPSLVQTASADPVASTSRLPFTPRYFHTSPQSRLFLFGLGERDAPQQHAENFIRHLQKANPEGLVKSYAALRQSLIAPSRGREGDQVDKASLVTADQLSEAMALLSKSSHINSDFRTLATMHRDVKDLWDLSAATSEDDYSYIKGLVGSRRLRAAERWLGARQGSDSPEKPQLRTREWNAVLQAWLDVMSPRSGIDHSKHYQRLRRIVTEILRPGERDRTTWHTLLTLYFASGAATNAGEGVHKEVDLLVERMCEDIRAFMDTENFATIILGFRSIGLGADADRWQRNLEEARGLGSPWLPMEWEAELVSLCSNSGDLDKIMEQFARIQEQARLERPDEDVWQPTSETLLLLFQNRLQQTLLSPGQAPDAAWARDMLTRLEAALHVRAGYAAYALAIEHCSPTFSDCLALYKYAQRDGIPVSSSMVKAAVRRMASRTIPEELQVVEGMYNDLMTSSLSDARDRDGIFDVSMYVELLELCARRESPNFSWAIQLLEDMRHNGLSFLNGSSVDPSIGKDAAEMSTSGASIVTSLMHNAATNHSQAFKLYAWTWPMDPDHMFTYRDWYQIIRTFADLDFPHSSDGRRSYVPPSIFFAFFEDMRKSGTAPGSDIFQAVLYYYAREGTRPNARTNQEAVRQIHDVIKMDQFSGTPDIGLMNRLMYAYSKTGNLDGAFNVWRSILVNKIPYNNVSISIIFDAYGYAGRHTLPQLTGLWSKLLDRPDFMVNKRNLESYVEALGRIGHGREAANEVFKQLSAPASQQTELRPDERTCEVLLKVVRSDGGLYKEVLDRIRQTYPDMWRAVSSVASSLPQSGRDAKMLLSH